MTSNLQLWNSYQDGDSVSLIASYQVGEFYTPAAESGLRYDDPALGLRWPLPVSTLSPKDTLWQFLDKSGPEVRSRMTLPGAGGQ